MGDGHHRNVGEYITGKLFAKIEIIENDQDVKNIKSGGFGRLSSIKEFIGKYESKWKEECDKRKVYSIKDIILE